MKIAIDARMLYATGIGRYIQELLDNLQEIDDQHTYLIIMRPQDRDRWRPTKSNFTTVEIDAPIYSISEQTKLAKLLHNLKPDLVHFTNFNSPVFYSGRRITTVHDTTLLDYSTSRGSLIRRTIYRIKRGVMRLQIRAVLRRSRHIITDAAFTSEHLIERKLAKAAHISTIWLGVPLSNQPQPEALRITKPFLLYVGNFYIYKNLDRLIEALPNIQAQNPGTKLVLAGKHTGFDGPLRAKAKQLGVEADVVLPSFVSDGELAWLYKNASAYVFPSLSEGFGLPPLEAMLHDLPVAASKASCIPEICGDAAVYFDPHNTNEVARVVSRLLQNKQQQKDLIEAGRERITQFSWRRMAEQTLAVYNDSLK